MSLTKDDRARLQAIVDETDDRRVVILIGDYWHDETRGRRTPREVWYFHGGMLSGLALRLLGKVADLEEQLRTERGEDR